ncbi:MAG: MBL fold metallo-hydrolase [Anaerolineae bacterium]|nr:MBL fold metallo-hydrolase [Anaerolineae bacterium]
MAQLILLGTGAALSDATREHTYLVVKGEREAILIDCAGSPVQRLLKAGVALDQIDHIILTHHHPDHIYGLSVLLLGMWLAGRKKPLSIYGLADTLRATRALMRAFEWERFKNFFPIEFHRVPQRYHNAHLVTAEFSVSSAPTRHIIPTIAVRIEARASRRAITYSSDTEVLDDVVNLARGSYILVHEATTLDTDSNGHTSARQAGEQATRADVKKLVLVHLPPECDVRAWRTAAQSTFTGTVIVGKDLMRLRF